MQLGQLGPVEDWGVMKKPGVEPTWAAPVLSWFMNLNIKMDALRVVEYLSSTLVTVRFANLAIYGVPPCGIWMAKHGLKAKHR